MSFDLKELGRELNDYVFTSKILSTNELIKGRPYTIRDELKLAQIQKATLRRHMLELILELIKEKFFSLNDKQIANLTTIDIQYLLAQLKIQGDDAIVPLIITCNKCQEDFKYDLDLRNVELNPNSKFTEDIEIKSKNQLKSKTTVTLKTIPFLKVINNYGKYDEEENISNEDIQNLLVDSLHSVAKGEEIKLASEMTREEILDFIESLPNVKGNLEKMEDFLKNPPSLIYKHNPVCTNCKHQNKISVDDFFFSFF